MLTHGNELKLVFPQPGVDPASFESLAFEHFFLQPMDGPPLRENTRVAVELLSRASAMAAEPADT